MVAAGGGLAGLAADGDLAGMEVAGRAAATCGTSTGPPAMEEKGQAGACRREKLGALVGWGEGDHLRFSDRSGQGHGSISKGWGRATLWSHARLQKKNFEDEIDKDEQGSNGQGRRVRCS